MQTSHLNRGRDHPLALALILAAAGCLFDSFPTRDNTGTGGDPCAGVSCQVTEYCEGGVCRQRPRSGCMDSAECPGSRDALNQVICDTTRPAMNACVPCDGFAMDRCGERNMVGQTRCIRQGANRGRCLECNSGADCDGASAKGICDALTNTCRACQRNDECKTPATAGVCWSGTCLGADDVTYVDRGQAYCDRAMDGDGTQKAPYCQLTPAIQAPKGKKPYVVVRVTPAAGKEYTQVSVGSGGPLTLIGPWADPALRGLEFSLTPAAVIQGVEVTGTADLTLDGFMLTALGGSLLSTAACSGNAASLALQRAVVTGSPYAGALADSCRQFTMDRCQVSGNTRADGIRVAGSTSYTITNSLIVGNGAAGGAGVSLARQSGGRFAFNTVVDNGQPGINGGGVACETGAGMKPLEGSIVVGNRTATGGTQLGAACGLIQVVIGKDDSRVVDDMTLKLTPSFFSDSYRLQNSMLSRTNEACCIDRIASTGVVTDYFGTPRPLGKNGKATVGYNEVN